jgi:hypothetical protein
MVGLVVALDDGIYIVTLSIGAQLRLRRLTDGRVRCMPVEQLRILIARRVVVVLARRPGRFSEMTSQALLSLQSRLPKPQGDLSCSFSPSPER